MRVTILRLFATPWNLKDRGIGFLTDNDSRPTHEDLDIGSLPWT